MKVKMLNAYLGIEKPKKSQKRDNGFFHVTETSGDFGVIRYIGPEYTGDLKVGDTVYFGDKRNQIRIGDIELFVMNSDNLFALTGDDSETSEESTNA